jgi:hypothetical protein
MHDGEFKSNAQLYMVTEKQLPNTKPTFCIEYSYLLFLLVKFQNPTTRNAAAVSIKFHSIKKSP